MFNKVTIDYITQSRDGDEFALYLVESPPWGDDPVARARSVQERVYNATDFVLDGQLASDYPDSRGKRVRIDVVCKGDDPPPNIREVVEGLDEVVHTAEDYVRDIQQKGVVSDLRIVYTHER